MDDSLASVDSAPISAWRPAFLFSVAGLASGMVTSVPAVFLRNPLVDEAFGFTLVYGFGLFFTVFMTIAGLIAHRLRWISVRPPWYQVLLAVILTVVSYPVAWVGGMCSIYLVEPLSHYIHFTRVGKATIFWVGWLVSGALIASFLVWIALGIFQRQWNARILLRLTILGVSWGTVCAVIGTTLESRLESLFPRAIDTSALGFGLLLSVGGMLFGGVCGHALATTPAPREKSAE